MPHTITHQDGFAISDDPVRFDVARAYQWIGVESYWSNGIPEETFRRAVANSHRLAGAQQHLRAAVDGEGLESVARHGRQRFEIEAPQGAA